MPLSWRSLDLLKQNLGGIGEGVTNYLKGRQEDEERNRNYEAFKQYAATPGGQGLDMGLAPLAFQASGYRALPAIQSLREMQRSNLPAHHFATQPKTGAITDIQIDPNTGKVTVPEEPLVAGEAPAPKLGYRQLVNPQTRMPEIYTDPTTKQRIPWMEEYDTKSQQPTGSKKLASQLKGDMSIGGKLTALKGSMGETLGFIDPQTHQTYTMEDLGLNTQQNITSTTRTMIETAPKVIGFVQDLKDEISKNADQLGPMAGRWNEFWTGQVGTDNPAFNKLRTDADLLATLLMRMHVGARGSEGMMEHFKGMLQTSKSPGNLLGALQSIEDYANEVAHQGTSLPMRRDKVPAAGDRNTPPAGAKVRKYNPATKRIE